MGYFKDTGKKISIEINGETVEASVFVHTNNGTTELRYDGVTHYSSKGENTEGLNRDTIENSIKDIWDDKWINNKKDKQPGFIKNFQVALQAKEQSKNIREEFAVTDQDYYFRSKFFENNSAQYPVDAIYNKTGESQDHLVISQYSYKAPRADDIWFNENVGISDLLTKGIGRNSPLDKFLGLVRMPMPNNITDSNNVRWGEDSLNAIEAAALKAVGNDVTDDVGIGILGGLIGGLSGADAGETAKDAVSLKILAKVLGDLKNADKGVGSTILGTEGTARILAALGIETSAESILARRDGVVPNSNLELLFQAPMLRQFSFMYKMSPRSKSEANVVNQILRFFKQGMAAKKKNAKVGGANGGRSYFLGTPNVFRLQYRTSNNEAIKGLNRIKTCALTGTSVNYTPEGAFASYDGGQPVSVLLTLGFQELEPIYDSDYKYEGGTKDERKDSDYDMGPGEGYRWGIKADEVGY